MPQTSEGLPVSLIVSTAVSTSWSAMGRFRRNGNSLSWGLRTKTQSYRRFEEGDTFDRFLKDFSTVTRDQAVQFLELANNS
jgi:hypothetical protein